MTRYPLICISIVALLASCARAPKSAPDPAALQPVFYHRTGGFAGVDDHLDVHPDGRAGAIRRGERPREFQLTRVQLDLLRDRFAGFDSLKKQYPSPPGAADDFQRVVRYGDRTVTGGEANADVPPRLRELWMTLDAIAQW